MNPEIGIAANQVINLVFSVSGGAFVGFAAEVCERKLLTDWYLGPLGKINPRDRVDLNRQSKRTDHRETEAKIFETIISLASFIFAIHSFREGSLGYGVAGSIFFLTKMVDASLQVTARSTLYDMIMHRKDDSDQGE